MSLNLLKATGLQFLGIGPVDLEVTGGEILALSGASGSGKSVTLRMLADLVPHEGSCSLDDQPAKAVPAHHWRRMVRFIPAESGWWAPTVSEHFTRPDALPPLLERLRLAPKLLAEAPEALSSGERQRMAFLRGLEDNPRVLLLDEPTAALDPDAVAAVETMIRERQQAGAAIVLVSHDRTQVERLAGRVQRLGAPQ